MKVSICFVVATLVAGPTSAATSMEEAARMMVKVGETCNMYVDNGEMFWRKEFKKPADAPGLVLLNKEIQNSVRKTRNLDSAKDIAWQKCLDFIFNNQNSEGR